MSEYIIDLEKTLEINKNIIFELVSNNEKLGLSKSVINSLNNANFLLQSRLKTVIKERDYYQSRLLITEQCIKEYERKLMEYEIKIKNDLVDCTNQLETKECLSEYLVKQSKIDKEAQILLKIIKEQTFNRNDNLVKLEGKLVNHIKSNKSITNEEQTTDSFESPRSKKMTTDDEANDAKLLQLTQENDRLVQKLYESQVKNKNLIAMILNLETKKIANSPACDEDFAFGKMKSKGLIKQDKEMIYESFNNNTSIVDREMEDISNEYIE